MNKIMAALDKKFAGQAQARLSTYAGKIDLLKVSAANATEIIGKGLVDALTAIGKDNSIDQATNSMNGFANAIANTAKGMGELIGQVKQIIDSDVGKFLLAITALLTLGKKQLILGTAGLIAYDIGKTPKSTSNFTYGAGNPRADLILQKKLTTAKKDEYNIITASNKARTEIDKLKDKFDLERIGLAAALNFNISAEDKLRVNALTAIANNNEALAKKYNAELDGAIAAKALADSTNQAAIAVGNLGPALFNALGEMTGRGRNQIAPDEFVRVPQGVTNTGAQAAATAAATAQTTATLTLDPNASSDKLVSAIGELVRVNLKYGNKLVPAGTIQ
jgi:hypothetical protein